MLFKANAKPVSEWFGQHWWPCCLPQRSGISLVVAKYLASTFRSQFRQYYLRRVDRVSDTIVEYIIFGKLKQGVWFVIIFALCARLAISMHHHSLHSTFAM